MPRKKLDYSYFSRFDPRRLPTWRYQRAQRLLSSSESPHPERDDNDIRALRKYYLIKRRMRQRYDDEQRLDHELSARFKYLWAADRIFMEGRADRVRFAVEAMLLARTPLAEIAHYAAVEPLAIQVYERLFFNVNDRLENRNYIASVVLLDAFMSGLANRTREITTKYFGYFAGPVVLRLILDGFDGSMQAPLAPADTSRWLDHHYRLIHRTICNVSVSFTEPNSYNSQSLFEGYQSLLSLGYREQSVGGEDNVINQALEVFVRQNPIPLGDKADRLSHRPGPVYAGGSVEPRVSEIMSLQQGHVPPALVYYGDTWKPETDTDSADDQHPAGAD